MIIDHISISIGDSKVSKAFYTQALAPLGIGPVMEAKDWYGFGKAGSPEFWFGEAYTKQNPLHIAFTAESHDQVDAFYAAAIAAGGKDNGPPGIRKEYHPNYYAAFVYDPDGHNIEAVCHLPQ